MLINVKSFKFQYEKDLDDFQRDALEGYLAFASLTECKWYKFKEDGTYKDDVYGDADPAFDSPVDLPVFYIKNPTVEQLSEWGVDDTANVVCWIEKKYLQDRDYKITNRDEIEIDSIRYHIVQNLYDRGQSEIEYIQTIGLLEVD